MGGALRHLKHAPLIYTLSISIGALFYVKKKSMIIIIYNNSVVQTTHYEILKFSIFYVYLLVSHLRIAFKITDIYIQEFSLH